LWKKMADKLGLKPVVLGGFEQGSWRRGADTGAIEARLAEDSQHAIKAVCVVHNETSTGATSDIGAVRRALDRTHHPALLLVDTISSLGSIDYRHDEWGVDVTVAGSQKGLMLPPGLSFNAVGDKALAAARNARLPKAFWGWDEMLEANAKGFFPYTPSTNLLYGLAEALDMLQEEGLPNVFARHARHAEATRRAVAAWGLEILCEVAAERSNALTAVVMPKDSTGKHFDADRLRKVIHENFNMSLGQGLSKLAGWVFRIGHLGDFNDLTLAGTLAGVEMGLGIAGVPHRTGGVQAALAHLGATAPGAQRRSERKAA
jgi:alanine-glyoxylate transaminase/serine-glyoxylate transaminase/serine-pyruvate transaminase